MSHRRKSERPIRFGVFELDLRAGELRKCGVKLKLQDKPLAILSILLERPGEVVTREELRERLWTADTFVDFDHSLSIAVHKLRTILGDNADNPRFIETLARRGYRFVAPTHTPTLSDETPRRMIAVLPFVDLEGDPQQEYFADGLTEEMITQLGRLNPQRLGVIARASAMAYRQSTKSISEIGYELGVEYILEGSVRRADNRVRISAQLVHVEDQAHIWAEAYDRSMEDIFAIQTDVAERIARSLMVELLPEAQALIARSATRSSAAYELYLHGRHHSNKRAEEHFAKALEYYSRAIEKDPRYALAYSGIADAYSLIGYYGGLPPKQAYSNAKTNALKALDIDNELAEPHTSLAFPTLMYDWNWPAAEKEHRRAIELNPNCVLAWDWYGLNLTQIGRFNEAISAFKQAHELDPVSVVVISHQGWLHYYCRQYDRAITTLRHALELDPSFALASWFLAQSYLLAGEVHNAAEEIQKSIRLSGTHPAILALQSVAYHALDRRKEAKAVLDKIRNLATKRRVEPYFMAYAIARHEDNDATFSWLERAYEDRSGWLLFLPIDPGFDVLRTDHRLIDLMQRINPFLIAPIPNDLNS
jgi:TolB-like protein/Tfp pilus assembly protein PilF